MAADPRGHGIRRRSGGKTSVYGGAMYALNGGTAVPCPNFDPAEGDPGHCANCGAYDGDHHESAMAGYDLSDWAGGIPGSDSSTGAY